MVGAVLGLAHLADPSAQTETLRLVPKFPLLRPADILTSAAVPGRLAALDIGVTSPDGLRAGADCCESMRRGKVTRYQPHFGDMDAVYRPLVWSAFGREHPDTSATLEALARAAARKKGLRDHRLLLRRTRTAIGVQLACRAVRMTRCTLNDDEGAGPEHLRAPELRALQLVDGEAGGAEPAEEEEDAQGFEGL